MCIIEQATFENLLTALEEAKTYLFDKDFVDVVRAHEPTIVGRLLQFSTDASNVAVDVEVVNESQGVTIRITKLRYTPS